MQLSRKSFSNLRALASGEFQGSMSELSTDGAQGGGDGVGAKSSTASVDSEFGRKQQQRCGARSRGEGGGVVGWILGGIERWVHRRCDGESSGATERWEA